MAINARFERSLHANYYSEFSDVIKNLRRKYSPRKKSLRLEFTKRYHRLPDSHFGDIFEHPRWHQKNPIANTTSP